MKTTKRPQRQLKDVSREKKQKGAIDKQFTSLKAAGEGSFASSLFTPTDDQLEKINGYTRSPKSADEVVCFPTMSCNDMVDRDDDRFRTACVDDFAKLPGDLSPTGKPFMVSHDYTKLPVGRIFDTGTTMAEGVNFLTNDVYMPNTKQNEDYLENLDFGVYSAVSVGVMLDKSACSICNSPMFSFFGMAFCDENGHEKGLCYDPDSDEEDDWGWALPVEETAKGAVKCVRELFQPNHPLRPNRDRSKGPFRVRSHRRKPCRRN